jgi:hypothetical protein
MKTTPITHARRFPACSAVFRSFRLSIFGLIGWFWFLSADDTAGKAVPLIAILSFAAVVGIAWYLARVRADRRWRAALDHYAQQELDRYAREHQAKRTPPWKMHR